MMAKRLLRGCNDNPNWKDESQEKGNPTGKESTIYKSLESFPLPDLRLYVATVSHQDYCNSLTYLPASRITPSPAARVIYQSGSHLVFLLKCSIASFVFSIVRIS